MSDFYIKHVINKMGRSTIKTRILGCFIISVLIYVFTFHYSNDKLVSNEALAPSEQIKPKVPLPGKYQWFETENFNWNFLGYSNEIVDILEFFLEIRETLHTSSLDLGTYKNGGEILKFHRMPEYEAQT
jgi:hypothetical protein